MRRAVGEGMLTLGGAVLLVLTRVMLNDRVREELASVVDTRHPASSVAALSSSAGQIVAIISAAARQQSIDHAPLVIFSLTATVLVLFMLRT